MYILHSMLCRLIINTRKLKASYQCPSFTKLNIYHSSIIGRMQNFFKTSMQSNVIHAILQTFNLGFYDGWMLELPYVLFWYGHCSTLGATLTPQTQQHLFHALYASCPHCPLFWKLKYGHPNRCTLFYFKTSTIVHCHYKDWKSQDNLLYKTPIVFLWKKKVLYT